jgi:glycosyltransferase involved in cell wall biosynthesis
MKVCMLAYAFYESDMRILRYAQSLQERGDTVDVIALRRSGAPAFEVLDGVNVYRVQERERNERGAAEYATRILRFMLVSARVLSMRHVKDPYDIIHVHSVPDVLVFAAIVPKILGAKLVLDIHDILPEFFASKFNVPKRSWKYRAMLLAERASAWLSDHVIIANDLWRPRLVSRSVTEDRCSSIINYPDDRLFFPRREAAHGGKFRITYPGTLNSHQGVDIAIRAMALLKSEMPELEFHIYGEGPSKEALMALTEGLDLSGVVMFHDFLPCDQIAGIMALSDIAVVPKKASSEFGNEAMSTKIMEFMAIGVPVIASRTKVDTFYHDESRIRFFTSEDPHDLAEAIRELRHDPDLRDLLAQNALEYMRTNGWANKQKMYLQLVDSLSAPEKLVSKQAGVTS